MQRIEHDAGHRGHRRRRHPAAASAGSCSGVRASACSAASAAADAIVTRSSLPASFAVSAAARSTVSMVPSTGRSTAAYAASRHDPGRPRARFPPVGVRRPHGARTAKELAEDDAGVAAGTEQGRAETARATSSRSSRDFLRGARRGHGEHQIRAGVPIGNREDVQGVDLGSSVAKPSGGGGAPPPQGRSVECDHRGAQALSPCCSYRSFAPTAVLRYPREARSRSGSTMCQFSRLECLPWLPPATSAVRGRVSATTSRTLTVAPPAAGTPTSRPCARWSAGPHQAERLHVVHQGRQGQQGNRLTLTRDRRPRQR